MSELEEGAWICPDCGQWGSDEFGTHSLPNQPMANAARCLTAPIQIPLGPYADRCRQNACEVTKEAVTGLVDLQPLGGMTAEMAADLGRRRMDTFAAFDLTPPEEGLTVSYTDVTGIPAELHSVQ